MKDEESSFAKWNKKKKSILSNLDSAIPNLELVLDETYYSQENLDLVADQLSEELSRLRSMRGIYRDNRAYPRANPVTDGLIDNVMRFTRYEAEHARRLASDAHVIRTNTDSFRATVKAFGSTAASNTSGTVYLAECMENKEAVLPFVEAIKKPSARDRRTELSSKLSAINPRLPAKLEGA